MYTFSGVFLTGFVSLDSVLAPLFCSGWVAVVELSEEVLPESVLSFLFRILLVGLR